MSGIRSTFLAVMLALGLIVPVRSQAARPVVRILLLKGEAIPAGELLALQNLIMSGVVELDAWRIIDDAGQELALREAESAIALGITRTATPLAADFILGGSLLGGPGALVFTLELTKVLSGEKKSVSETLANGSEAILAARRLVRALFSRETLPVMVANGSGGTTPAASTGAVAGKTTPTSGGTSGTSLAYDPTPTLSKIAGAWTGDKGLDRVSLFADGRGIAILSSGATMRLRASIAGATVSILQDQPNLPEFFRAAGIDFAQADRIAQLARPARWIFSLSMGGDILGGRKETVFVKTDAGGKLSVDNSYTRDASWSRLTR